MKVVKDISGLRRHKRPICLAVGFFDGVHVGHQEVLGRAMRHAQALGGEVWAMTFDPHPLKVLNPDGAPPLLTDTCHKLALLDQFGIDGCLLIPFSKRFAAISATRFLDRLGQGIPSLRTIVMGHDWRFGHKGTGDRSMLEAWAAPRGITVHQVPAVKRGGRPVSSTRVRQAIACGKLAKAQTLLGRPFSLLGKVVPGNRIGRTLGYPTANLEPSNEVTPPTGIYAVHSIVNRRHYEGVLSFGTHPTVAEAPAPVLELHLFGTRNSLYRSTIEVFFIKRLRNEKRFRTTKALIQQIGRDVEQAKSALEASPAKNLWIRTLQRWHPEAIVPTNK